MVIILPLLRVLVSSFNSGSICVAADREPVHYVISIFGLPAKVTEMNYQVNIILPFMGP